MVDAFMNNGIYIDIHTQFYMKERSGGNWHIGARAGVAYLGYAG